MIISTLINSMLTSPIDEIKSRLNIVDVVQGYIKLQKTGANFRAVCPFHTEKKPSFFVSPARQIWHCFGCNSGGDLFTFIMKIEGVEFGDALRILAQKAGVELVRQDPVLKTQRRRLYEIGELACCFFEKQLEESSSGKEAKKYLLDRNIKEETIKKWRLGYSPNIWQGLSDFLVGKGYTREEVALAGLALKSERGGDYYDRFRGRIIFPVFDLSSQPIGFGGRIFKTTKRADGQEEAKYINTPNTILYDKGRILYGLNKGGIEIRKEDNCILVEGYVDAIMVNQAGFENVVANSGTALTPYQLNLLRRYSENLLLAYDMDIAGDSATKRGINLAQAAGFNIKIVTMPESLDPADVVSKDPKIWEEAVKNSKTIHDFYFETTLSSFDKKTLEGKKAICKTLLPIIKIIPNKIEQSFWVKSLAEVLEVKEEDVLEELKKVRADQIETAALQENSIVKSAPAPKTRKELLEEHLAVVLFKSPQCVSFIKEEDINLFTPSFARIFTLYKNNGGILKNNVPAELNDLINYLSFRAEVNYDEPDFDLKKEFSCCFKEIKNLAIKNRLDFISQEIKKAEEEKDLEKIQKLMEEFNLCAQTREELETS